MAKVLITDTILRDAHQSQAATRMRTEDMLPACEILDKIGYYSLECWGGATFDACLRFLNEDPWERLRKLRKALPNTKLQMLFRGQNILGYKHYCRRRGGGVRAPVDQERHRHHPQSSDALNDVRNLETAIKATKKYGGICEVAMSYTVRPRAYGGLLCKTRAADRGTWRGHHLHQGHGQPASALQGVQSGQAPQGERQDFPSTCTPTTPPARAT